MAGGVGDHGGGIAGLARLLTEHGEAVEYDLIALGLRLRWLGSEALTWGDLRVIVAGLPPSSRLAWSVHGEDTAWGLPEYLLAAAVDALAAGNWQRGGGRGRRPEPLPRPGLEPDRPRDVPRPVPIDDMRARLGWEGGGQ